MRQHHSFERVPSLWGIAGILLVFILQISAPRWMKWRDVEAQQPAQERIANIAANPVADIRPELAQEVAQGATLVSVHSGYQPFEKYCASCHGLPGVERVAGLTASDLFDGISERPMTKESILSTLQLGILEKGMLPMSAVLSEDQLEDLVLLLLENQPEASQNT